MGSKLERNQPENPMFTVNAKSIQYTPTDRGVAFTAELLEDGLKVGSVNNKGNGGGTFAYARPASMKRIKQLAFTNGMSDESYLEMLVNKAEGVGSV